MFLGHNNNYYNALFVLTGKTGSCSECSITTIWTVDVSFGGTIWNLGKAKIIIETMLVNSHPSDWLGGTWVKQGVSSCSFAWWPKVHSLCLLYIGNFASLISKNRKLAVPLVMAPCKVAMDTSFYPDNHFQLHCPWCTSSQSHLLMSVMIIKWPQINNYFYTQLQIWDTAGQERFRKSMVVHYYRNVSAVIFMYDITREGSFKALATWLQEYEHYGLSDEGEVPKLMIGNKCDLIHERVVSSNQARKFADLHSMPVWEVSTKNDEELETIESIFLTLSHKLVSSRSFMDRPRFFASVDSINDSMRSKSGKSHKARHSQKRIKLKPGQQPKRKCCESSWCHDDGGEVKT